MQPPGDLASIDVPFIQFLAETRLKSKCARHRGASCSRAARGCLAAATDALSPATRTYSLQAMLPSTPSTPQVEEIL